MSKELREAQDEAKQWKRLYTGMVRHNDSQQKAISTQTDLVARLQANLDNCQKAVDLNKVMLHNAIAEHSRKEQEYIGLINKLKNKLRELGYGDFNRLGDEGN